MEKENITLADATHSDLINAAIELRLLSLCMIGAQRTACLWGSELLVNLVESEGEVEEILAVLSGPVAREASAALGDLLGILRGKDPDRDLELRDEIIERLKATRVRIIELKKKDKK